MLVHGGLQDLRLWQSLIDRLSHEFRVIAYSRRHHHPNVWTKDAALAVTPDVEGEDLAALIKALSLAPPLVVAHSAGAVVALSFAAAHPAMLQALILSEPPATGLLLGTPGGEAVLREFETALAPARMAFRRGDLEEGSRSFTDAVNGRPGEFDRLAPGERQMAMDNAAEQREWAVSRGTRPTFTCEHARRIGAPVLLLMGERSPMWFHRIAEELGRCLQTSEWMTIPGAAHTVMPSASRIRRRRDDVSSGPREERYPTRHAAVRRVKSGGGGNAGVPSPRSRTKPLPLETHSQARTYGPVI